MGKQNHSFLALKESVVKAGGGMSFIGLDKLFGAKVQKRHDKRSYFGKQWEYYLNLAAISARRSGKGDDYYDFGVVPPIKLEILRGGGVMEKDAAALKLLNAEMKDGLKGLQDTVNIVFKTSEQLTPIFNELVKETRDMRMTVTTELQKSLKTMKDVRKFFFESDHKEELKRLQEFVTLGERMRALISDGTMDAVVDVAIKLAVGRED